MTQATRDNKFKCDGEPTCTNAPTHAHRESGKPDRYYCDKCCPLAKCPHAQGKRL